MNRSEMIHAVQEAFAKSRSCSFKSERSKLNMIKKLVDIVDEYTSYNENSEETPEQVSSSPEKKEANYHMKVSDSIHRPRPASRKPRDHGITIMTEEESRKGDKNNPFDR